MNSKTYKYFGLALIILSSIIILESLSSLLFIFLLPSEIFFSTEILFVLLMPLSQIVFSLLLGFFPGIFYYKFGKQNKKDNGLIKTALFLNAISLILIILAFIIVFILAFTSFNEYGATAGALFSGFLFLAISIIPSIAYAIGIILLTIYASKNKSYNKKANKTNLKKLR